jgi:lactate 2-monooxygenase
MIAKACRPLHTRIQTTLFGRKFPSPLLLAPIGVQGIFHADAEIAPARAAKNLNIPYILSTAASRTIEEVAEANAEGERWFQLYWYVPVPPPNLQT